MSRGASLAPGGGVDGGSTLLALESRQPDAAQAASPSASKQASWEAIRVRKAPVP